MMPEDLRTIIDDGEHATLAWALADDALPRLAETMVAMANTNGGQIIMGVADDQIVGVADPQAASDALIEAALATEPPLIIPVPEMLQVDGCTLITAYIPSGMPNVYAYQGKYLRRRDAHNAPLSVTRLRRLMIKRGEMNYEAGITQDASLNDIDWEQAEQYADNLKGFGEKDVREILLKRGCLVRYDGKLYPTNAGILLFGRDPQRFIIASDITAVRFAGQTMSDTFNRQDITGTLAEQIKRAETFLVDHLRKSVTISDKMRREENFEYPLEAARELLINAVAHRDYSIRGDNIRLFIYSNRMQVYSPGGLPGPMTLQNLREERFSRNPIIVQVLADMNFIEKLGYGVDRVIDLMRAKNLREPDFHERTGGFEVVIYNALGNARELADGSISFDGVYKGQPINERQEAALVFLHTSKNSRITNSDLKELFEDVHPETLRRDLADLVTKEILVKLGAKRGSYYMLKEKASAIKESDDE
ncbi:MAG: ATP-binding protein [Anaerolineae bacterium]